MKRAYLFTFTILKPVLGKTKTISVFQKNKKILLKTEIAVSQFRDEENRNPNRILNFQTVASLLFTFAIYQGLYQEHICLDYVYNIKNCIQSQLVYVYNIQKVLYQELVCLG